MPPLRFSATDVIAEHSAGLAAAARDNLDARVEHCPDWDVASLVAHVTEVHWFWGTIVSERLTTPPGDDRKPATAPRDELVDRFLAGAAQLGATLEQSDPSTPVWTWAPKYQNAGFVTRHQVQEAAVHHWDAANAAGLPMSVAPAPAADAIEEFLTVSVYEGSWPLDPPPAALDGAFGLSCLDLDAAWTVRDGDAPGLVAFSAGVADGVPTVSAPASDLLLWLYRRVAVDTSAVPTDLITRFRGLSFTD